jgi:hypothetical protein
MVAILTKRRGCLEDAFVTATNFGSKVYNDRTVKGNILLKLFLIDLYLQTSRTIAGMQKVYEHIYV